ncbi:MAG: SRPBCC domain-containing protein [Acidimicrobiia bacterium]
MTNATQTTVTVHRIYIHAPMQQVWDAITDPAWNGRYGYGAPSNYDLKPGGLYAVPSTPEMQQFGAPPVLIDGEVLECDPPTRLVQTWRANFTPDTTAEGFTQLTWELSEEDSGITRLTVTHDVTDAPNVLAATTSDGKLNEGGGGWAWILSDLKTLLETGKSSQG